MHCIATHVHAQPVLSCDRIHSAAAHFATPRRSAASSASVHRWLGRSRTTVVPDGGMLTPLCPAEQRRAMVSNISPFKWCKPLHADDWTLSTCRH